ncbi:MAG TPA: hypothetical protein VN948_19525 [Terriglobales bacterium]|nr:hypothetical protein [Terriglobales bacterium]
MDSRAIPSQREDGCRVCGDACPLAARVNPGINKALAPNVGLASFDSLGTKYSGRDGGISEHVYAHGFRRDLLLLGFGRFYPCQKLRFSLHGAVIVNQHNPIVEECVQRPIVTEFVRLIPSFSRAIIFDWTPGSASSCAKASMAVAHTKASKKLVSLMVQPSGAV